VKYLCTFCNTNTNVETIRKNWTEIFWKSMQCAGKLSLVTALLRPLSFYFETNRTIYFSFVCRLMFSLPTSLWLVWSVCCNALLQSRHLFTRELRDPEVSVACAKVMAQFHQLTMPFVKQPRWLFDTMTRCCCDVIRISGNRNGNLLRLLNWL